MISLFLGLLAYNFSYTTIIGYITFAFSGGLFSIEDSAFLICNITLVACCLVIIVRIEVFLIVFHDRAYSLLTMLSNLSSTLFANILNL